MNSLKQLLVGPLCLLLCSFPVQASPQSAAQHAGQINALIPAASRNAQPVKVQDQLQWNDLLKTTHSGRVRAGLDDGSMLSLGSDSELRIVQHDSASQQTALEMNFGKVRSQVVKIAKPGGKFEVTTPNAVIGVIGTDFYVGFERGKTTVICYEGKVTVTPKANAQAQNNSGQASGNSRRSNGGNHQPRSSGWFSNRVNSASRTTKQPVGYGYEREHAPRLSGSFPCAAKSSDRLCHRSRAWCGSCCRYR